MNLSASDPAHPARSALRLYSGQRRRLSLAAVAFALKQSPVWIAPLLTANIIDAVVSREPVSGDLGERGHHGRPHRRQRPADLGLTCDG